MNADHKSISNHLAIPNKAAAWSSCAGLSVTVISTTEAGTISALKAATCLAADLSAEITLLNLDIVPAARPLYRPGASLKCAMNWQRSVLRQAGLSAADVDLKIRLCRDWRGGVECLLRRRSLIVIGGKRRWWTSAAERLERLLCDLGHHVILVDVVREEQRAVKRSNFRFLLEKNRGDARNHVAAQCQVFGAETRKGSKS